MQPSMKPRPHSVRASQPMDAVSQQERSSTVQQTFFANVVKTPLPWTGKKPSLSSQDKHRAGHSFGQPYLERKCEPKPSITTERVGLPKTSENVRGPRHRIHRSHDDGDDNDKELVKYMSNLPSFLLQIEKQSNVQDKALNFGVLDWKQLEKWKYNERMPPGKYPQKGSSSSKARQYPIKLSSSSHDCDITTMCSGNQTVPYGLRFGSPKEEKIVSYHKGEKYAELGTYNKGTCNQEYQGEFGTGRLEDHFHQRAKSYEEATVCNSRRKNPNKEMRSKEETLRKRMEMRSSEIKLTLECHPELDDMAHIKPGHFKRGSSERSQFTESRILPDGQLAEMVGPRLSDFFCPQELKSGEFSVSGAHTSKAVDVDCSPSASESKRSLAHEENGSLSSLLESSDNKQAEISENLTLKELPSSPTRRFSFHLGRMSRSLSFKDNLAIPQLSSEYNSIKSGPVRPEISSATDNFKSDQASGCSRARSSPLRRLLNPMLKHKGAHPAETIPMGSKVPSQDRRLEKPVKPATLQTLLQLTLKNGLPFFKLVVNNSSDMLAATVKRLPASGKSDSCMMYSFYSVHEIKKKGMSWMNQGLKSKSCNLGYNIVGQMKISCNSRECVLYEVDQRQADEQALENEPQKELVAVIVGNPSKMEQEENKNGSGTLVILPGGVHGLPIEGTPSSLISRWRFGGSCDCGGWDVGCKLRVLVDCKKRSHGFQASELSSSIDIVNLYMEGGEKENKPIFAMKPLNNGFYSIELDASISLLEAFSTCVAHVTCSKFLEITDAKIPAREHCTEAIAEAVKRKSPTAFQEQLPAYVTCPPLSPAGRI